MPTKHLASQQQHAYTGQKETPMPTKHLATALGVSAAVLLLGLFIASAGDPFFNPVPLVLGMLVAFVGALGTFVSGTAVALRIEKEVK